MTEAQGVELLADMLNIKEFLSCQLYLDFVIIGGMVALGFFMFWKKIF